MRAAVALVVVALATIAIAASGRVTLEQGRGGEILPGWQKTEKVPCPKKTMKLIIALKNKNLDQFDTLFWQITNPKHANYGKYLSVEELADLTAPSAKDIASVQEWLVSSGMTLEGVSLSRDFLHFSGSVQNVEKMLQTKFATYEHQISGAKVVKASAAYSVPAEMADHMDYIAGVIGLAKPHTQKINKPATVGDAFLIGPAQLRARYNVTIIGSGAVNNSYAVAEFQGQYYSPADLVTFFHKYVPQTTNDTVYKVVGTNNGNAPGVEAELDIQYIMGVAPNVEAWFYSQPAFDFWSDLTAWTANLANTSAIPWVHSISYGDQAESQPSESYKTSLCTQFQKLGARGVSVIFASGDSGTGCDLCVRFQSSFPATCPYVTAVGATQFINGTSGPESAVSQFGSGGGFSASFPTPPFQVGITESYLNSTKDLPPFFYYSKDGRGTPDVAALGIGFGVVIDGQINSVGGTSCSAPTFSAIVSMLNELRFQAGKPSMGFLNNWIYQTYQENPGAWWDVTVGDNHDGCCLKGFPCAKGWDPVTGVGTANFAVLKTLIGV